MESKRQKRLSLVEGRIALATEVPDFLNMMVWGRVKSGKTLFACTGPKPIVLMAERGALVVRNDPRVQLFPVRKSKDRILYRPMRWKDTYDFLHYLRYGDHDRETAVVDTMSALTRVGMRFINRDEEARDDARAPGTTDQRTWGRLATLITEFMEDIEEICATRGMHLIYTSQERVLNEEKAEQMGVDCIPDFTPQIRAFVTAQPSILARTFIEEEENEEDIEAEGIIKYGMTFRDADLLVGERVTPLGAKKPWLPRNAYNVTVPKILRLIQKREAASKKAR